jgi:Ran GTPase-activating protein (RanGAP) involved in mRNA processing and transport
VFQQSSGLKPDCKLLETLTLNKTGLGAAQWVPVVGALGDLHFNNLQVLNFDDNPDFQDVGAAALAHSLRVMSSLSELSLIGNKIEAEGMIAIAGALPDSCKALRKLVLDKNWFGTEGAKALALAMPRCDNLEELSLKNIGEHKRGKKWKIQSKAAVEFATALPLCKKLQVFDITDCDIGDHGGAKAIAESLAKWGSQTLLTSVVVKQTSNLQNKKVFADNCGPKGKKLKNKEGNTITVVFK